MTPESILILGAGELGGAVLRSLANHPLRSDSKVAVLLRPSTINSSDASKQNDIKSLTSLGIDVVGGDVVSDSVEQLATTFGTFHTVINCTGMYLPPGTQIRVAEAAIASGCRKYYPWEFGVDYEVIGRNSSQDLFTEKLDVRDLLRGQSEMDFVLVSTGVFISFLFEPAFDIVNAERDTVTAIGSWGNSITVTSPEDIGKLTAEVALACPDIKGVVYTAGDTVSMQQLAEVVDNVIGIEVTRRLKTVPQLKEELAMDPNNGIRKYRVVFGEGAGGMYALACDALQHKLMRPNNISVVGQGQIIQYSAKYADSDGPSVVSQTHSIELLEAWTDVCSCGATANLV